MQRSQAKMTTVPGAGSSGTRSFKAGPPWDTLSQTRSVLLRLFGLSALSLDVHSSRVGGDSCVGVWRPVVAKCLSTLRFFLSRS